MLGWSGDDHREIFVRVMRVKIPGTHHFYNTTTRVTNFHNHGCTTAHPIATPGLHVLRLGHLNPSMISLATAFLNYSAMHLGLVVSLPLLSHASVFSDLDAISNVCDNGQQQILEVCSPGV